MIRTRILLTMCLAFSISNVSAQNMYGKQEVPDNWSGTAKGSDLVQVDMFTGAGSVNIPIYNYSLAGLDLGVSLYYDAKGIKVDQLASSVGLGWALGAGGSITRELKGLEDEITTPAMYSTTDHLVGRAVSGPGTGAYYQNDTPQPIDDEEFDIFHINLCGRTLAMQFYYDNNTLKYTTYPKSEIKIDVYTKDVAYSSTDIMTYNSSNVQSGIKADIGAFTLSSSKVMVFNITDEQGNKFFFESGDFQLKDYEYDNSLLVSGLTGTYSVTDKWDLVKVITYNGFTIDYEYKYSNAPTIESINQTIDPSIPLVYTGDVGGGGTPGNKVLSSSPLKIETKYWNGWKTHLNKISYPNGVIVKFDTDHSNNYPSDIARLDAPGDFIINNILIESKYDLTLVNTIKFKLNYAFFTTPIYGFTGTEVYYNKSGSRIPYTFTGVPAYLNATDENDNHWKFGSRLKLKSIERYGLDGQAKELMYSFDYNSTPLPYRFASQKDYFGYYNGNSTTAYLSPNLNYYNDANYPNSSSIYPQDDLIYLSVPLGNYSSQFANGFSNSSSIGTNKAHSHSNMQACALTKVKNGLGGTVEIQYADYTLSNNSNQYKYYNHIMVSGTVSEEYGVTTSGLEGETVNDGLVVGALIETNIYSQEHNAKTEYIYEEGQRFNRGGYSWYPHMAYASDPTKRVYHNYWVSPNDYFNGSNHGFSKVTVKELGFNNEELSKTIYRFSNMMYDSAGITRTNMIRRTGEYHTTFSGTLHKYKMGLLQKVESYDENNYLVSKEEFTYQEMDYKPTVASLHHLGSSAHFHGPEATTPPTNFEYYDPSGVVHETYYPINYGLMRLASKTTTAYMTDQSATQRSIVTTTAYGYDNNDNVITQTSTDSKGDVYRKDIWYNDKYKSWYTSLSLWPNSLEYIDALCNENQQFAISTELWKVNTGADDLISFSLNAPEVVNNKLRFPATFTSTTTQPIAEAAVFPYSGSQQIPSSVLRRYVAVDFGMDNQETNFGSNLMLTSYASKYDAGQNPVEVWTNERKEVSSYIWDNRISKKLAEVANAEYDNIAFTSFEGKETFLAWNVADENKGNWEFDKSYILRYNDMPDDKVMTGQYAYKLDNGASIVKSKALNEQEYIISFWGTGEENQRPDIKIFNGSNLISTISYSTYENKVAKGNGDWYLYVIRFNVSEGEHIEISNPNSTYHYYIDELRLHPADAVMASYSYEPLVGVTATNDASNYIIYTEYDVFSRYFRTRDMRGNIVEQVEARIQDLDNSSSGGSGGSSGGFPNY